MVNFHCKLVVSLLFVFCGYQSVLADKVTTSIITAVLNEPDKNVVFSPLLLSEGLYQLYLGAQGSTLVALSRALQLIGRSKYSAIMYHYNWFRNLKPYSEVIRANSLFVSKNVNINPIYVTNSRNNFGTVPQSVDFGNVDTPRQINSWIARATRNKITNLIERTDNSMQIMLLSAIYLKGSWKYPFDKVLTRKDNFYVPQISGGSRTVQVDMMTSKGNFRINQIQQLDCMSFELPYTNPAFSMVILLPKTVNGIDNVIANLNKMDINDIAPKSKELEATIKLPKFKFEIKLDLRSAMARLGLAELFMQANLTGMTDFKGPLHIGQVIQKAVIEVDEVGSTATVVQEIGLDNKMLGFEFQVDHPFVFLIKNENNVYFAGRVTMP